MFEGCFGLNTTLALYVRGAERPFLTKRENTGRAKADAWIEFCQNKKSLPACHLHGIL